MKPAWIAQYTAVAIDGRALLLCGKPGCGKTSLALQLIDRGAGLIGDDGVTLSVQDGIMIASPPPNIAGKLEIRGVGIVEMATTTAPVALILHLGRNAVRYTERADRSDLGGISIPLLRFYVGTGADAIRAEYALQCHGLTVS